MDNQSIELFLDVWRNGSLTAAAGSHYLTESTVSKRIVALEKELGIRLFQRGKGKSQARLTPEGEAFADIAQRMLVLTAQAQKLKEGRVRHYLTVASINSVQDYTLPPFIKEFQKLDPKILFTLEDHRSTEIFPLLEHQRLDIGITQTPSPYSDLESKLLYNEDYRVIMKPSLGRNFSEKGIHPSELKAENEIYESYCDEFREWHDHWWKPFSSRIRVNITPTAEQYFQDENDWMIVPESIAGDLQKKGYASYALSAAPPRHHVYIVYRKRSENADVKKFVSEIIRYFSERGEGK
jgi:DNA-binding transcriptional LysR family regulator